MMATLLFTRYVYRLGMNKIINLSNVSSGSQLGDLSEQVQDGIIERMKSNRVATARDYETEDFEDVISNVGLISLLPLYHGCIKC